MSYLQVTPNAIVSTGHIQFCYFYCFETMLLFLMFLHVTYKAVVSVQVTFNAVVSVQVLVLHIGVFMIVDCF